ncbi:MAG: hypothetical protein PHX38_13845 [Sulfuricella sp.]|nr:hypothetical protein [Sulfuricella sp.]
MKQRFAPTAPLSPNPLPQAGEGDEVSLREFHAKRDFPLVRRALATFAISLLLAAILTGASLAVLRSEQDALSRAQAQRNEAGNRRLQAETARRDILAFQPEFIRLRERGLVGEEKRLDWMEQIGRIREERKLLPISYEFSARQDFRIDPSLLPGELQLRASKLTLHMDLLHELDLLGLLDELKTEGFYVAQACSIKRTGKEEQAPLSPRLGAECTLYRPTLGEPIPAVNEGTTK